jgi:hypothetical protein
MRSMRTAITARECTAHNTCRVAIGFIWLLTPPFHSHCSMKRATNMSLHALHSPPCGHPPSTPTVMALNNAGPQRLQQQVDGMIGSAVRSNARFIVINSGSWGIRDLSKERVCGGSRVEDEELCVRGWPL